MLKLNFVILCALLTLIATVSAAPICAKDDIQVRLANNKVKRKVVHVTRTVATVSKTSFYVTATHTVTAPLVEVLISGDSTYTLTLSTNVANSDYSEGQTYTTTNSQPAQTSIGTHFVSNNRGTNGGYISTWSSEESLIPSNTGATSAIASATESATESASNVDNSLASSTEEISTSTSSTNDQESTTSSENTPSSDQSSTVTTSIDSSSTDYPSTTSPSSAGSTDYASITSSTSADSSTDTTPTSISSTEFSSSDSYSTSTSGFSSVSSDASSTTTTSSSSSSSSSPANSSSSSASATYATSTVIPTALIYSPYNDDQSCKDYDSVKSDLQKIVDKNIPSIRVYGTDCNYLSTVVPIAQKLGLKINQGFWFSSTGDSSVNEAAAAVVSWAQENTWDVFEFFTIGNEAINQGYMSVDELLSIMKEVRDILQDGGFEGNFTTSEPPVSFENHPELCKSDMLDIVGINPHSYFDADIDASQAGSFVAGQKKIVEEICTGKKVFITETGYPSQGNTNGLNVPSKENQAIAIKSILDTVGSEVTILTMYNDFWKDPGSYGIEQYFGAYDLLN